MTLVDRQNFHLFQPLAYQVATGALSTAEIATPLRSVLKRQPNGECCWPSDGLRPRGAGGDSRAVAERRRGALSVRHARGGRRLALLVFRARRVARFAPELKSLGRCARDPQPHPRRLRGSRDRAGCGAEASLAHVRRRRRRPDRSRNGGSDRRTRSQHAPRDFHSIDTRTARVVLVEASDRILTSSRSRFRARPHARSSARRHVLVGHTVVDVDAALGVDQGPDGEVEQLAARTVDLGRRRHRLAARFTAGTRGRHWTSTGPATSRSIRT